MDFLPDFESSIVFYLFIIFAALAFLQLLYVLLIHGRLAFYKSKKLAHPAALPAVSVVIAARNESDNLYAHLPKILEQQYPNFEVIVVNHQSTDDSSYILTAYQQSYPHLKIVNVEKNQHLRAGKKLPLTLGIKAARHEHLVFTDADCLPSSNQWLRKVVENFSDQKKIVIGYGPYKAEKGFLNKIIRLDTAFIAMNYFSFSLARMPYMAVGRNLAYTRETFNAVSGFKSHYSLNSGDDDLFIQEAAKKKNYTIELDPDTFCYSLPETNWKSWFQQKSRHYTTSDHYNVIKKLMLGIYPLTLLMMWISFVILMFNPEYRWITLAVAILVMIVKWWIQARCMVKLQAKGFIGLLPFLDLFYAILSPALFYTTEKSTTSKWK